MSDTQLPEFEAARALVESEIDETASLLMQLGRDFQMARHEYVFVGRSPALLAALAQEFKDRFPVLRSWVLPISLVGGDGANTFRKRQELLRQMIKAYRPADWPSDRDWVFVDTVGEGTTMSQLDLLTRSLLDLNPIHFAVLTSDRHHVEKLKDDRRLPANMKIISMSIRYENEIGRHKLFSPYDSINLNDSAARSLPEKQEEKIRFRLLRTAIRQKVQAGDI